MLVLSRETNERSIESGGEVKLIPHYQLLDPTRNRMPIPCVSVTKVTMFSTSRVEHEIWRQLLKKIWL